MARDIRSKMWTIVVYPDSLPDNWLELLDTQYIDMQFAISPLHDKDIVSNGTGDYKKPHYHIVIKSDYRISQGAIFTICDILGTNHHAEIVRNGNKILEYLYHKNDSNKAQYSSDDTIFLHEFSIDNTDNLTLELIHLINTLHICEFAQFVDYLVSHDMVAELGYILKSQNFWNTYIRSRRFSAIDSIRQSSLDDDIAFRYRCDCDIAHYIDKLNLQYPDDDLVLIQDNIFDYLDLI